LEAKNLHPEQSIDLAGVKLHQHCHVCAFFHTQGQEDKVVIPFMKEAIERGEKSFCVLDSRKRAHALQELTKAGIEIKSAQKRGQLELRTWEETYVQDGRFDQEAMLQFLEEIFVQCREQGFAHSRFVAHMDWAMTYGVETRELLEYEVRLNHLIQRHPDPVLCVYDLSKFNAGLMMDVLRTHPMVIIGGLMAENPFYVSPEVFLDELRERTEYTRREDARLDAHGH
jgi:MEDS: MEthanogen/methylotroph, DcmR Sensory domain